MSDREMIFLGILVAVAIAFELGRRLGERARLIHLYECLQKLRHEKLTLEQRLVTRDFEKEQLWTERGFQAGVEHERQTRRRIGALAKADGAHINGRN